MDSNLYFEGTNLYMGLQPSRICAQYHSILYDNFVFSTAKPLYVSGHPNISDVYVSATPHGRREAVRRSSLDTEQT
jgi:hypothetical protein